METDLVITRDEFLKEIQRAAKEPFVGIFGKARAEELMKDLEEEVYEQ